MTAYMGVLQKEPGSLWGIWFPDLPGCIAADETSAKVLAQVPEALSQWLELRQEQGAALPVSRSIEELREDEWVKDGLAKGHIAILVSLPGEELGFDPQSLDTIDAAATERGLSRLDFVRQAVLEKIAS